jgi:hypothetical protein
MFVQQRADELDTLDQLADAADIQFRRVAGLLEGFKGRLSPAMSNALRTAQLALLVKLSIQFQREESERRYLLARAIIPILYDPESLGTGRRLKEIKAVLGDNAIRLLAVEEDLREWRGNVAKTLGDVYSRLAGGKLRSGTGKDA